MSALCVEERTQLMIEEEVHVLGICKSGADMKATKGNT